MNSYHDSNHVHTLLCVQDNGSTLVNIQANPSTHGLAVSDAATGSENGPYDSRHDANHIPVLVAVSSVTATVNGRNYVQGVTPVIVYGDSSGNLLVNSA